MKNIKSIIFDLGGVLLNISYQKTIYEFEKLVIDNLDVFYSQKKQSNIFNYLECGKITAEKFIEEMQKNCNNSTPKQILFAWNAMLLDLPNNRINLLNNLKEEFHVFLLSNTNEIHINKLQSIIGEKKYNKFYSLFKKVYYSHEIGIRKPHAEVFRLILDENNLKVKEVLFIDDSIQHIDGAKKLGIQTYHLQDNEEITTIFPGIIQ